MIRVPAKDIDTQDGPTIVADGELPAGWKVRYIGDEFQAIPTGDEWPA